MTAPKMQHPRRPRKSSPPLVLLPAEPRPETEAAAWRYLCRRMREAHLQIHLEKLARRGDLAELVSS